MLDVSEKPSETFRVRSVFPEPPPAALDRRARAMHQSLSPEAKADIDAVVEAIVYLYTESRRLTKDIAQRYGLTGPQLTVVKMLEALGDLSLSNLSAKIKAQNSTVTGIVDRMEREGLVVRARSASDRRVVHIGLTPKGAQLAREVPVEPITILRRVLSSLSDDDVRDLLRILTTLASGVQELVDGGVEAPAAGGR